MQMALSPSPLLLLLTDPRDCENMDILLAPLLKVIISIANFLTFAIIVRMILSWLFLFGIVNSYSNTVSSINEFTYRLTEPLFSPIRRLLPNIGNLDLAPIVALLGLYYIIEVCTAAILALMQHSA